MSRIVPIIPTFMLMVGEDLVIDHEHGDAYELVSIGSSEPGWMDVAGRSIVDGATVDWCALLGATVHVESVTWARHEESVF